VNSRPLTHVSTDIDETTITPNHFLRGFNRGALRIEDDAADPTFEGRTSDSSKLLMMWKKGQRLLDQFWKLWKKDYLLSLRERTSWFHKQTKGGIARLPRVGEAVLVDDSPKSRSTWKIGKVERLIRSHDNVVRTVDVRVVYGNPDQQSLADLKSFKTAVISRPLNLLYPLEIDPRSDDKEEELVGEEEESWYPPKEVKADPEGGEEDGCPLKSQVKIGPEGREEEDPSESGRYPYNLKIGPVGYEEDWSPLQSKAKIDPGVQVEEGPSERVRYPHKDTKIGPEGVEEERRPLRCRDETHSVDEDNSARRNSNKQPGPASNRDVRTWQSTCDDDEMSVKWDSSESSNECMCKLGQLAGRPQRKAAKNARIAWQAAIATRDSDTEEEL
jgi:hypothetical protein